MHEELVGRRRRCKEVVAEAVAEIGTDFEPECPKVAIRQLIERTARLGRVMRIVMAGHAFAGIMGVVFHSKDSVERLLSDDPPCYG
jgi:hypothetical protein